MIYSGPNIGLSNPMFKTPRSLCVNKNAYDSIDLEYVIDLDNYYFPRSNFKVNCTEIEYSNRTQVTSWNNLYTENFRLIWRRRLNTSTERTLLSSIIPKGTAHIHTLNSIATKEIVNLPLISAYFSSIPHDFFIKITGKDDLHDEACDLPIVEDRFINELSIRALMLNCLSNHYSELWELCWNDEFKKDRWAKEDYRLKNSKFTNLTNNWDKEYSFRNYFERRQALIEIDVLTSIALGMTLEELKTIYRIQFPVLYSYEADTWYDQNGKIVFTNNKGLTGVGIDRRTWETIKNMESGTYSHTIIDDTMPGGPVERTIVYEAPFDRCDREKDYEEVWKNFEERFKDK